MREKAEDPYVSLGYAPDVTKAYWERSTKCALSAGRRKRR